MIRITQRYFDSIVKSISDTAQQIVNKPNGSFVEAHSLHIAALRKLLLEIEVVDYMTGAEAIVENEKIFNRMNFFKSVSG
jgi:hypothetical protein